MSASYTFTLKRVHMYNQELSYKSGSEEISVIAEDSPEPSEGLLVWEQEFADNPEHVRLITTRFEEWAKSQKLKYTVISGKKRC